MSKKTKKYTALHTISYDDLDFGRTSVKPGSQINADSMDDATVQHLLDARAITLVTGDEPVADAAELARQQAEANAAAEAANADAAAAAAAAEEAKKAKADAKNNAAVVREQAEALTVAQLKDALTAAEVEFEKGANKAALVELYVADATK